MTDSFAIRVTSDLGCDAEGNIRTAFEPERDRLGDTARVERLTMANIPEALGHGVAFEQRDAQEQWVSLAFIDGFDWLHGSSNRAVGLIRKPGPQVPPELLADVRRTSEEVVARRERSIQREANGFRLCING